MSAATDHLAPETLSRYVDRAVSPEEAAAMARHLAECDACHRTAEELREAGRLLLRHSPLPEWVGACPAPAAWAGFVADGGRPELEAHLAACPDCRTVLAAQRTATPPAGDDPGPDSGRVAGSALVCFRCRASLGDGDQFCPRCGAQITARTGTAALVRRGPGAWFTHVWLAASLGALGLSFFWGARFYQCLAVSLGCFLLWLHLRNPVGQYLDILTALQRGDAPRADALLENLRRRFGGGRR